MKYKFFLSIILITLFITCAKEGFPPGGPEDLIPPEVVRTIPVIGETHVDTETSVQIWFSEGIQSASALGSVFITPYPGENAKIRCRGSKMTITFFQPLISNLTYVITLGTGIKDYRNNPMLTSYTLAFSTGEKLDRGEISGNIYDVENSMGIDVWTYRLEDNVDPNPILQEPDYIVQSGANGEFQFSYLSPGTYRLYAVRDQASDRLYKPVEDEIGLTYRDAFLADDDSLNIDILNLKIMREDTLGPSLIRAVPIHRNQLTLLFDEILADQPQTYSDVLTITSKEDSEDTLSIVQIYKDPQNGQRFHVLTEDQDAQTEYLITVKDFTDESGNPIDTLYNQTSFIGADESDTVTPALLETIPSVDEKLVPLDIDIRLIFSEAMDPSHFAEGFSLSDSSDHPIMGSIQWISPAEVTYYLEDSLYSQTSYTIHLFGNYIRDLAGNSMSDTLFQFQTLNHDTLSAIVGQVSDSSITDTGDIYITAKQIENLEISYVQILPEPGDYHFMDILPGQYTIECFRDRNRDGQYGYGKAYPYQPSERFVIYSDTVVVRSRWPNEGNDLILP